MPKKDYKKELLNHIEVMATGDSESEEKSIRRYKYLKMKIKRAKKN